MVARVWRKKARESVMISPLSHHSNRGRLRASSFERATHTFRPARGPWLAARSQSNLQFSPPQRPGEAHAGFDLFQQRLGVQKVEETFHLASECTPIAEPPDFFQARQQVGVDVFHAHHFFQSPAPMRAAPAALHASMGTFADAETRPGVFLFHGAASNVASPSLAAGAIAS